MSEPSADRQPYRLALATTDRLGRFSAVGAGDIPFTIDNGKLLGEAEHPGTAEYFLASLAGCALNIIAASAVDGGLPEPQVTLDAGYLVNKDDSRHFDLITLDFRFGNLEPADRRRLVDDFVARCPIYNTLARGGAPIVITLDGSAYDAGRPVA